MMFLTSSSRVLKILAGSEDPYYPDYPEDSLFRASINGGSENL